MQLIVSPQARDGFREAYRFVTANNPEAADSTQERP
jgi:plasmid stabilization system protein ParE